MVTTNVFVLIEFFFLIYISLTSPHQVSTDSASLGIASFQILSHAANDLFDVTEVKRPGNHSVQNSIGNALDTHRRCEAIDSQVPHGANLRKIYLKLIACLFVFYSR